MIIKDAAASVILSMNAYLNNLSDDEYTRPLEIFSGSSIGQHTRHVVEFFQCLVAQSATGVINYDKRVRNHLIETSTAHTIQINQALIANITQADLSKILDLAVDYSTCEDATCNVPTNFERELVYTVEHAIHHLAMVKIGLKIAFPHVVLPDGFGVAPSTIKHQKQQYVHR